MTFTPRYCRPSQPPSLCRRLRESWPKNRVSISETKVYLISTVSRQTAAISSSLRYDIYCIYGIYCSLETLFEVKNEWSYIYTSPYAFMVWRLINHRNFIEIYFYFQLNQPTRCRNFSSLLLVV